MHEAQHTAAGRHFAGQLAKLNVPLREEEAMAIRDKFERNKQRDSFLLQQMAEKVERLAAAVKRARNAGRGEGAADGGGAAPPPVDGPRAAGRGGRARG